MTKAELLAEINSIVTANGLRSITGTQMNGLLTDMVNFVPAGGGGTGPATQVPYFDALGTQTSDSNFTRIALTGLTNINWNYTSVNGLVTAGYNTSTDFLGMGITATGILATDSVGFGLVGVIDGTPFGGAPTMPLMIHQGVDNSSVVMLLGHDPLAADTSININPSAADGSQSRLGMSGLGGFQLSSVLLASPSPDIYAFWSDGNNIGWFVRPQYGPGGAQFKLPQLHGLPGQVLTEDGSGNLHWASAGGGGGSPGGSDTQVQFNSGGSFGGDPDLTWSGSALTLTSSTLRFTGIGSVIQDGSDITAIDPISRVLYNASGNPVVNWDSQQLFKAGAGLVLDWGNNFLYDQSGLASADWNGRALYDTTATNSLDWANRFLIGEDGTSIMLNWQNPALLIIPQGLQITTGAADGYVLTSDPGGNARWAAPGAVGFPAGTDYQTLILNGSNTPTWSNILYGGEGQPAINMNSGTRWAVDDSGQLAIEWSTGQRYLFDHNGGSSLNWDARVTYDTASNAIVDWGNYLLSKGSDISVDWGNRQLKDQNGQALLDWNSPAEITIGAISSTEFGYPTGAGNNSLVINNVDGSAAYSGFFGRYFVNGTPIFSGTGLNDFDYYGEFPGGPFTWTITIAYVNNDVWTITGPTSPTPSNGDAFTTSGGAGGYLITYYSGSYLTQVGFSLTSGSVNPGDIITDFDNGWSATISSHVSTVHDMINVTGPNGPAQYPMNTGLGGIGTNFAAQNGHTVGDSWTFITSGLTGSQLYINTGLNAMVMLGDIDSAANNTVFTVQDYNQTYDFNKGNFNINSVPYSFPSTQGAPTSVLLNNGMGGLHWQDISGVYLPLAGGTMNPGASIFFGTGGQNISQGTFDNSTGGNQGISLTCAIGFELNWQGGHLSSSFNAGADMFPIIIDPTITLTGLAGNGAGIAAVDNNGTLSWIATGGGGLPSGSDYQTLTLNGSNSPTWSNVLYDQFSIASFDYWNRYLFDSAGVQAIWYNGVQRYLFDSNSFSSVNWDARVTYDTASRYVVDWGNYQLSTNGILSVDWGSQLLYDASGNISATWGGRTTYDTAGARSLDWQNREAIDNAGFNSVDWGNRWLVDSSGAQSVDWSSRQLFDEDSNLALTYTLTSRQLLDASGHNSADWGSRELFDALDLASLNWNGRTLLFPNGDSALNWSTNDVLIVPNGLNIPTGAAAGYVLTSDGGGNAAWATTAGVYLPLAGGTMNLGSSIFFGTSGQNIMQGSFDNGTGGDNGISLNCSVGFELNWQGGHLSSSYNTGTTKVPIIIDPTVTLSGLAGNGVGLAAVDNNGTLSWIAAANGSIPKTMFTPLTGDTISLVNINYNVINPAGPLLALTINLPSSPVDDDFVEIKFTQSVTTVTYGNGTVVGGITSPMTGSYLKLVYDAGTTTWY